MALYDQQYSSPMLRRWPVTIHGMTHRSSSTATCATSFPTRTFVTLDARHLADLTSLARRPKISRHLDRQVLLDLIPLVACYMFTYSPQSLAERLSFEWLPTTHLRQNKLCKLRSAQLPRFLVWRPNTYLSNRHPCLLSRALSTYFHDARREYLGIADYCMAITLCPL